MIAQTFRVMVVDDEDDFRVALVHRLQERNIDVHGVDSGEKAIETIQKEGFDVIILDLKMPGLDGLDILREVKRRWPFVEVIMHTGHASLESGIEAMKLDAFDYIIKPRDFDGLVDKIHKAVEKKELTNRAFHTPTSFTECKVRHVTPHGWRQQDEIAGLPGEIPWFVWP